jgi:hypothetical protein
MFIGDYMEYNSSPVICQPPNIRIGLTLLRPVIIPAPIILQGNFVVIGNDHPEDLAVGVGIHTLLFGVLGVIRLTAEPERGIEEQAIWGLVEYDISQHD